MSFDVVNLVEIALCCVRLNDFADDECVVACFHGVDHFAFEVTYTLFDCRRTHF